MTKVWIIEQGQYSDYGVSGIFSTEENAQKVADLINKGQNCYDTATVAPRELDPAIQALNEGLKQFTISMERDGTYRSQITEEFDLEFAGSVPWVRRHAPWVRRQSLQPSQMIVNCFATDEKHAVKITNEHRLQFIALNKWPAD